MALGKVFDKEENNIKILKSLNRSWQPKVTAISESRDLTSMNMATLFGKLKEHELELRRLKEEEEIEEKKSIALKATSLSRGGKKSSRSNVVQCYECGNDGHIKPDCPALKNKQKEFSKYPQDKNRKQRKAYIAWENSDEDSSSDDDNSAEEESNLCFMEGSA
ncbi:uncharacterized protein HKW66_Vig0105660 [Vigna angularis]|uniref:CCHC-type domain-containing protein n=1 Tax=Phaseolus angularis TaxID=3914 RepID=A0A8T0KJE3_PHAAN|nr:uncharacterized protein LOC108330345 [Vigna angularis]KAG2399581.1 uncharacterized protein HKW66_Vig0105660 [Vigna angularis]